MEPKVHFHVHVRLPPVSILSHLSPDHTILPISLRSIATQTNVKSIVKGITEVVLSTFSVNFAVKFIGLKLFA